MRQAPARPESRRQRGFALLIVLWALVLLSLLVTHMTSAGRAETRIAANLAGNAEAEAAAEGAVYETVFRLLDFSPGKHWEIDGKERKLQLDRGTAVIRIESEAGKVNPSTASPELLAALMSSAGVDTTLSAKLGSAIADWREAGDNPRPNGAKLPQYQAAGLDHGPPGEAFESLDELGRVLGMTPEILARLRPHLSLYQLGDPDPKQADPVVRAALQRLPSGIQPAAAGDQSNGQLTVTITVDARMTGGARFTRRAVIRLGPGLDRGFEVLSWEQPIES